MSHGFCQQLSSPCVCLGASSHRLVCQNVFLCLLKNMELNQATSMSSQSLLFPDSNSCH